MENPNTESGPLICPNLGLRHDRSTTHSYASSQNYCYRCPHPAQPSGSHQSSYCLTPAHINCPVYLQDEKTGFPDDLRGAAPAFRLSLSPAWMVGIAILVMSLLSLIYLLVIRIDNNQQPVIEPTQKNTHTPTAPLATIVIPVTGNSGKTQVKTPAPSMSPSATPAEQTPTVMPSITSTPTIAPTRNHLTLDQPFIIDGQEFTIHRVLEGEGYDFLAIKYNTTTAMIADLNYDLSFPLWTGTPIIIAPGMTEKQPGLPSFRIKRITENGINVQDLAIEMQADPVLIEHYNNCTSDYEFSAGEWVLIPYPD